MKCCKFLILLFLSALLLPEYVKGQQSISVDDYPLIGAQVFIEPGQTEEETEGWFRTMRDNGMSVCRIRMFESYMRKPGGWDFSLFDRAFRLAEKYDIKIIGTFFPLTEKTDIGGWKFPESRVQLNSFAEYIKQMTTHFKQFKSLYAWVLINEPGGGLKDNEFSRQMRKEWNRQYPQPEYLENGYPVFTAVCGEERVPVRLKVMGSHNVANAMVSLAVASVCGIPMRDAAERLAEFTGFKNRQQIYHVGGMTIIDDTYNASPVSMKAGLEVLNSIEGSRARVAVLADMKELGPDSPRFHYEIGTYIAENPVDKLAVLGELAREIARGVREQAPEIRVYEFMDRESLIGWLKTELREGDTVLFKGSNSMELGKVAAVFLEKQTTENGV